MSKFYTRPRSSSPIFQLTPLFFTPNHSSRRLTHSLGYWLNTICTFFAKINKIVPQCSVLTSFTFFYSALPLLLCLTLQMFAPPPLLCFKFGQLCLPVSLCYSHTASLTETGINIPRLQLYFIVTCFLLSRGSSSAQAVERPSSQLTETDRAVEDSTKPGSHVQVDVPREDVVCLSLLKAGDDTVDPIIIELIG